MKGNTNIQVNGNVYGGIHVGGRGAAKALPSDCAPQQSSSTTGSVMLWCAKWLGILAGGSVLLAGAIVAGGLVLGMALVLGAAALAVVLSFYVLCRLGELLLWVEYKFGGSNKRLVGTSLVTGPAEDFTWQPQRLGDGEYLDELRHRKANYVDSN